MKETFSATTVAAPTSQSAQQIKVVFIGAYRHRLPCSRVISTTKGSITECQILSWTRQRPRTGGSRLAKFAFPSDAIQSHDHGQLSPIMRRFFRPPLVSYHQVSRPLGAFGSPAQ